MIKIQIPWFPPELAANSRTHWRKKAAIQQEYKTAGFDAAICAPLPILAAPTGLLNWGLDIKFFPPHHKFDLDNCLYSIKYAIDGIAEAFSVNDRRFRPISMDFGNVDKDFPRVEIIFKIVDKPI